MKSQNGIDYEQNYDIVIKWLSAAFKGETLEVLGLETGPIEDVFGFEPADISVMAGRVDVMFRNHAGALYHLEAQRNLRRADLCRFAAYHFLAVQQWGSKITDIILASGDVSIKDREIITDCGRYSPIIIDLSERDPLGRLAEIREAVNSGEFTDWLELVFLPLYGKETGDTQSNTVEQILRFESELHKAEKIPATLLAAALIMSNRLIDKERLRAIWEEINMLDILEIAKEEGIKEGKKEEARDMVIDALKERFVIVPADIRDNVYSFEQYDVLRDLHRLAIRSSDIDEFKTVLSKILSAS